MKNFLELFKTHSSEQEILPQATSQNFTESAPTMCSGKKAAK